MLGFQVPAGVAGCRQSSLHSTAPALERQCFTVSLETLNCFDKDLMEFPRRHSFIPPYLYALIGLRISASPRSRMILPLILV